MKTRLWKILTDNCLLPAFWIVSVLIELTAVTVTGGAFFIRKPWIWLSLLLVFSGVMYAIGNQNGRFWFSFCLLLFNFFADLVFIVIYEMTDTVFDFSMLNLRSDAMAIIESLPINFWFVLVAGSLIGAYLVFGRYYVRHQPKKRTPPRTGNTKLRVAATAVAMALTLVLHGVFVYFSWYKYDPADVTANKLYRNDTSSYADKGPLGNFFAELYKGAFFSKVKVDDPETLENFLYSDNAIYDGTALFGAAKDYNVITVLAESFEWFSFMNAFPNGEEFVLGHTADQEILRKVYPNLYALYDSSVTMTGFRSREKTDISENLSIMGAYPTDKIINYDYPKNTVVTSLARTLKELYGADNITANYFHNGTSSFYNRNTYLTKGLGFDSFTAADDMNKAGMPDHIAKGERNLDSEMINTCFDKMFPTDKRFYTYITTITQHGQYEPRDNLAPHYAKLDEFGLAPLPEPNHKNYVSARNFRTYAAAAIELDAAISAINRYLDERGLTENTLLVLFGDHNAYYSSLSSDIKGITDGKYDTSRNYTDLYRVPFMIRIGDGKHAQKIDKFTCTADILPTIYDLLGIKTFGNFLYGHSVFDERESVLYSRAYDVFLTDKMYFTSINKIRYQSPNVDQIYREQTEQTAHTLLEKVSRTNQIFYTDYFKGDRAVNFYNRLRALNES